MSDVVVGLEFTGTATGAVGAARETAAAIGTVKTEASGLSPSLRTVEKDTGNMSRGMLAGTGSITGMGRSLAYASGAFLGAEGLIAGIKGAIEQAETLEKASKSLDVVIRRNNGDVAAASPLILKWARSQQQFGISVADSTQGLARAAAVTGSVQAAMTAYDEALVISKATGKDMNAVLIAASKAQDGQTSALSRYIGTIPKGTTTQQLYNDVMAKYKGQAESNTSQTDKLHASLQNIELRIGQGLLPVVKQYETELDKWLGKSSNQKKITDDVTGAVHGLRVGLGAAADVIKAVDRETGGLGNTLKIAASGLIAYKIAAKAAGVATELMGAEGVAGIDAIKAAMISTGVGALVVGIGLAAGYAITHWKKVESWFDTFAKTMETLGKKIANYLANPFIRAVNDIIEAYNAIPFLHNVHTLGLNPAGSTSGGGGATKTPWSGTSGTASKILEEGTAYGGAGGGTYRLGGGHGGPVNPKAGSALDCSGFVYQSLTAAGCKGFSDGNAYDQFVQCKHGGAGNWHATDVGVDGAKPGDIVYWNNGTSATQPEHCGIVASGSGRSATCMQYKDSAEGSGYGPITEYPAMGVFRITIIKSKSSSNRHTPPSTNPYGNQPPPTTGATTGTKKSYKIPVKLENQIRQAQAAYAKDATKANLDYLLSLYEEEDKLYKEHGEAQPAIGEIAAAKKTWADHMKSLAEAIAKHAAKVAGDTITKIEAEAIGPANTLKLAQAAGASTDVILSDQEALLAAYKTEAAQLKAKMAKSTGEAKAKYKTALANINSLISSTQDGVVGSLQSLYQTAADTALGNQYFQNGLQTPAEAALAAMQAQDTTSSLNDTLTQAQQQLQTDTASGADAATIAADNQAISSANRAIQENQLAITAAQERAKADADYAKAVYNLNQSLAAAPETVDGVNKVLAQFGLTLGGLTDPGGNGLLDQFTTAVAAATSALNNLTVASGGQAPGGSGAVTAPPGRKPVAFASGGKVPGIYVNRDSVPAFLTPGETVIDRKLTAALERLFVTGGGLQVAAGDVYLDGQKVGKHVARPVTDAQAREHGYTLQRG